MSMPAPPRSQPAARAAHSPRGDGGGSTRSSVHRRNHSCSGRPHLAGAPFAGATWTTPREVFTMSAADRLITFGHRAFATVLVGVSAVGLTYILAGARAPSSPRAMPSSSRTAASTCSRARSRRSQGVPTSTCERRRERRRRPSGPKLAAATARRPADSTTTSTCVVRCVMSGCVYGACLTGWRETRRTVARVAPDSGYIESRLARGPAMAPVGRARATV